MPYKDKEKRKETIREAMRRKRGSQGVHNKEGFTSLDTPQDVKAVITEALGSWHPVDEWTPEELATHRERIVKVWSKPGDYNRAYRTMIGQEPGLGWDKASREAMARLRGE